MSQHTPGPWVKAPTGPVMHGYSQPIAIAQQGAANMVAGVFDDVSGGRDVADANASLIAAAPDLLAVADMVLATATCHTDQALVAAATEAIKKARGES